MVDDLIDGGCGSVNRHWIHHWINFHVTNRRNDSCWISEGVAVSVGVVVVVVGSEHDGTGCCLKGLVDAWWLAIVRDFPTFVVSTVEFRF